jgi:hypothetical protein
MITDSFFSNDNAMRMMDALKVIRKMILWAGMTLIVAVRAVLN